MFRAGRALIQFEEPGLHFKYDRPGLVGLDKWETEQRLKKLGPLLPLNIALARFCLNILPYKPRCSNKILHYLTKTYHFQRFPLFANFTVSGRYIPDCGEFI